MIIQQYIPNIRGHEAGQVKVNYTGLSLTGFIENVARTFNVNSATPTIVGSPTTTFPVSTPNNYSGIYDSSRSGGKFIENPINGQTHLWRFQILYSNKPTNLALGLDIILVNPVSGFQYVVNFTLPESKTSGQVNGTAISIADQASIPSPQGYIVQAVVSKTEVPLIIEIASITRISLAIN